MVADVGFTVFLTVTLQLYFFLPNLAETTAFPGLTALIVPLLTVTIFLFDVDHLIFALFFAFFHFNLYFLPTEMEILDFDNLTEDFA